MGAEDRELEQALSALLPGWRVAVLHECASTMDVARERSAEVNERRPLLVMCGNQTAGRGRKGRPWLPPKKGLYVTLAFGIDAPLQSLSGYSLLVGYIVSEVLNDLGVKTQLKWPNDVLAADGRKLAGVLVELENSAAGNHILYTGIGLNIAGAPENVPEAAALDEFGVRTSAASVAPVIAHSLYEHLPVFLKRGFAAYRALWLARASGFGSEVSAEQGGAGSGPVTGTFVDCSDAGHLILDHDGRRVEIVAGDIQLLSSR